MKGQRSSFSDFESWHNVTCRTHSITQCRAEFSGRFRAKFYGLDLGSYGLAETSTSIAGKIRSQREARDIRRDQVDDLMLLLVLSGRADLEQNDRSFSATGGSMILYDQARPFSLELTGPHRLAALNVSRSAFEQALPRPSTNAARVGSATLTGAFAASTLAQFVSLSQSVEADVASQLAPSVLDIVATALEASGSAVDVTLQEHRLLTAAKAYIDRHLGEPLSVVLVAEALGVSPRALNRLFCLQGTAPMRWTWERRLAAAHTGLRSGRFTSVTQAAIQCGFGELSHFSRAFKAAFGRAPSDILRRG